jgi:hypothetical protein
MMAWPRHEERHAALPPAALQKFRNLKPAAAPRIEGRAEYSHVGRDVDNWTPILRGLNFHHFEPLRVPQVAGAPVLERPTLRCPASRQACLVEARRSRKAVCSSSSSPAAPRLNFVLQSGCIRRATKTSAVVCEELPEVVNRRAGRQVERALSAIGTRVAMSYPAGDAIAGLLVYGAIGVLGVLSHGASLKSVFETSLVQSLGSRGKCDPEPTIVSQQNQVQFRAPIGEGSSQPKVSEADHAFQIVSHGLNVPHDAVRVNRRSEAKV